jgi:hypothetical protein
MTASRSIAAILLLLLAATGCTGTTPRDPSLQRVQRNIITQEQIRETRSSNAFEVVETLRSNWLLTRGVDSFGSPGQVLVYYNDTRLGGIETLRTIPINDVGQIQYFDGTQASARWGLDHGQGVIYVTTLAPR